MRIESRIKAVQRRAVGADDLFVVAHVQKDVRMIGYGAMLIESLVGVTALIAAAALPPQLYYDINVAIDDAPKWQQQVNEVNARYGPPPEAKDPLHKVGVSSVSHLDLGEVEEKVGDGDEARWTALEGDVEKITIRIPAELKDLATQAAQHAGTSANSWFVRALARALRSSEQSAPPREASWGREERGRHGRSGSRFTGWVGGDDE